MIEQTRKRLIILGTGFAAFRLLKSIDTRSYEVIVVSPRNYFLFTPLLASSAVGTIEFRSIVEPIRLANDTLQYYQASCVALDPEAKTIVCRSVSSGGEEFPLRYDVLVIAVGATTATFGVQGAEEHALFLKDIPDARALRSKVIECFERANEPQQSEETRKELLRFAVIGGGPTGVEFAAELHDLVTEDLSRRYQSLMPYVSITILEASERLLSTFDATLSEYTAGAFQKQHISVRTGTKVAELRHEAIVLQDGTVIGAGLILWSAGIAPVPFLRDLPFTKERGRLLTDDYLRIEGHPEIYAVGDCAAVSGTFYPATGQLAQSQGKYLATTLNRMARERTVKPFSFLNKGMLAYVGSGRALMDAPGVKGRGFFAWILWRSIYLTKLVSLRNKISVLFDWLRTFLFGRDFSRI